MTPAFEEPLYYLSTILDPRYKDCYFDTTLRATAIDELQQEVHRMAHEEDMEKIPGEEEEPGQKRRRQSDESGASLMDMLDEILEKRQSSEQHTPKSPSVCQVRLFPVQFI